MKPHRTTSTARRARDEAGPLRQQGQVRHRLRAGRPAGTSGEPGSPFHVLGPGGEPLSDGLVEMFDPPRRLVTSRRALSALKTVAETGRPLTAAL